MHIVTNPKTVFAANLKAKIAEKGLTHDQAAEALGMTVRRLRKILYAETEPDLPTLKTVTECFDVDDLYLFISKKCA